MHKRFHADPEPEQAYVHMKHGDRVEFIIILMEFIEAHIGGPFPATVNPGIAPTGQGPQTSSGIIRIDDSRQYLTPFGLLDLTAITNRSKPPVMHTADYHGVPSSGYEPERLKAVHGFAYDGEVVALPQAAIRAVPNMWSPGQCRREWQQMSAVALAA